MTEELIFRGHLSEYLAKGWKLYAELASALIYSGLHFSPTIPFAGASIYMIGGFGILYYPDKTLLSLLQLISCSIFLLHLPLLLSVFK